MTNSEYVVYLEAKRVEMRKGESLANDIWHLLFGNWRFVVRLWAVRMMITVSMWMLKLAEER